MKFLSDSERVALINLLKDHHLQTGSTETDHDSDTTLIEEALLRITNKSAERLYSILHQRGRHAHTGANAGLTLIKMHKIADKLQTDKH